MDREQLAHRVREHAIRMTAGGGCFLGASLSCTDLLVHLYTQVLNVSPESVDDPDRDYLLLSKGHDVPALYGLFAELGFISKDRLRNHLSVDDHLYWHPNRNIPGVEFHSGSLGHLLSVSMGIAMDIKRMGGKNRVFVILGDGECNEGSVWEGLLVAAALEIDNLVVIVDRNGFQANQATEELVPLEPLVDKFVSFGWHCTRIDGHNFDDMDRSFARMPRSTRRPYAIVADTVRNKGLPSIEGKSDRWFVKLSPHEIDLALTELRGGAAARLTSKPMVVR